MGLRDPELTRSMQRHGLVCVAFSLLCLGSCAPESTDADPPESEQTQQRRGRFAQGMGIDDADLKDYWVEADLALDGKPLGTLAFTLYGDDVPVGTRAFLELVDGGWYDGTVIHRVDREFVLQAGADQEHPDPLGLGGKPFTPRKAREHHYGTLGWASPPAREFIVCLAESPRVWSLDQQGQVALGELVAGVACLEELANVETKHKSDDQKSVPVPRLELTAARVREGAQPSGESIARPRPDLRGEPERVGVRHIRVTFRDRGRGQERGVTRSRAEAQTLAQEVLGQLQSGAVSFADAASRWSDDEPLATTGEPAVRRISNFGVVDIPAQRARLDAPRLLNQYVSELALRLRSGELSREELMQLQDKKIMELALWVQDFGMERREEVNSPAYTEAAFSLSVGEVKLVPFDRFRCPGGWYVLERVE